MRDLDTVQTLDPDMRALAKLLAKLGPHTACYAFTFETELAGSHVHARCFSPTDQVFEDPATGSAAGACGAYLAANERLPAPSFIIEQGIEMQHASRIEVSVEAEGKVPKTVRVGGRITPIIRGTLHLP
jgi:trans-2,3-dihydro-3-hydroxyanthranilate isomerase